MAEDKEYDKQTGRFPKHYSHKYRLGIKLTTEAIRTKAYFLSLTHPENSELDNWLIAENVVNQQYPYNERKLHRA
jgi:hypothetical protein